VPDVVPSWEKGNVLQQVPTKVTPELQIIELTCANRKLWAALRTERTTDKEGKQLLDEVGRPLRHTFGAMFPEGIRMDVAASEVSRLTPRWLASSPGAHTLPDFMATGEKRPPNPRSRWAIGVVAAAIMLSIAMGASNVSLRRQIADQENQLGNAKQIIQDLQTKLEKAERMIRDLQPKPDELPRGSTGQ
jgi:hypothetical protein